MFISGKDKKVTKSLLCSSFKILEDWLFENYVVLNPGKCNFMCIGKNVTDLELLYFIDQILRNCREVEILGITLGRNLNLRSHIKKLCRKAGQKVSALLRVSSYIDTNKKALLHKSMIKSLFTYCSLAWMFCPRQTNKMINKVYERALRLI